MNEDAISRGALVTGYLQTTSENDGAFTQQLQAEAEHYNGYNLLMGCMHTRRYSVFNNHTLQHQQLQTGYYGLSNASLDTPWPKLEHGKSALAAYCDSHAELNTDALFTLLANQTKAADENLRLFHRLPVRAVHRPAGGPLHPGSPGEFLRRALVA